MTPQIVFIDDVCPKQYDTETLETTGQGGTESTVTRIADGLANLRTADVFVEQHCRTSISYSSKAWYVPKGHVTKADYVICLRSVSSAYQARLKFPNAKLYLWLHDLAGHQLIPSTPLLSEIQSTVICVSDFHRTNVIETMKVGGYKGQFPIKYIYNPIQDELTHTECSIDKNKLLWISSPHKGIDLAYQLYENLSKFNPAFCLYVANPGYIEDRRFGGSGNICNLSVTKHSEVMEHLRTSLCLFYPNTVFPETFGLVFAEANAVGTPVLTHRLGAASEILDRPESEITDCFNPKEVIDKVMKWHNGERPIVRAKKEFRLSNVLRKWISEFKI